MATKLTGDAEVTREINGLLVRCTAHGIYLREKGRRLEVGPKRYEALYQELIQQSTGHAPIKPRAPRRGSVKVSRGLLSTENGK